MIKARNNKIAMILVLTMLMTMFVGLGSASADTTTYSTLQVPYLATNTTVSSSAATLGTVVVDWDTLTARPEATPHSAIIVLPDGLEFTGTSAVITSISKPAASGITTSATIVTGSKKEVRLSVYGPTTSEARMLVMFQNIKVTDSAPAGLAEANFLNISGLFPQGKVAIGNVVGTGAANISVLDTKTITGGSDTPIEFTVQESTDGGIKKGESKTLTFKLPRGFSWTSVHSIENLTTGDVTGFNAITLSTDERTLEINRGADALTGRSVFKITGEVRVDETLASYGDVNVAIAGKNTVMPTSLKIGSFADFGYEITVKDSEKEVLAGRSGDDSATIDEAYLSSFTLAENIAGSLLNDRTIYFELPQGINFYDERMTNTVDIQTRIDEAIETTLENGGITFNFTAVKNKPNMVKGVLSGINAGSKDKIKIDINALIAVDYVGDVTLALSGSAGINDTITLAKVIAPITAKSDVVDVKIGSQNQVAGNITITEVKAETLIQTPMWFGGTPTVTLSAPAGVSFAKLPTVKVTEGDLLLGTHTLSQGSDGTRNNVLVIPVRSSSDIASTIEVSDVEYSLDRTVPEGKMEIEIGGEAVDRAWIVNRTVAATVVAANCVTPAPSDLTGDPSVEFRIDSNIYYVDGKAMVMDVAPYITDGRTFLPIRYVAYALGINEEDIVWDSAARTVTVYMGDDEVELTIGSTTMYLNGEAIVMDTAPEITNDRTMLPIRWVAEAFGRGVGWDNATRTVLIN